MNLLEAVNIALRASQQDPATSLDTEDVKVNMAISAITKVRKRILQHGFGFNTRITSLAVDTAGRIPIPFHLDIELPRGLEERVDTDDGEVYVWDQRNDDWYDQALSQVRIVNDIPQEHFGTIPERFAQWIANQAAVDLYEDLHAGTGAPPHLVERAVRSKADALNSVPAPRIDMATGWGQRSAMRERITDTISPR